MKKIMMLTMVALMGIVANTQAQSFFFGDWGSSKKTIKASNKFVRKQMKVEDFNRIVVSGSFDVTYKQVPGDAKIDIYTSDNILEALDIKVENNTLKVGFKKGYKVSYNKLEVRASSEVLNEITLSGSGDVKIESGLKTNWLKLAVAGSGDLEAENIFCKEKLNASVAGSGDMELEKVVCGDLKISIAGSGDMDLEQIDANDAEILISGSGTTEISGNARNAKYSIAGSGEIYAANFKCVEVNAEVTGSGEIECQAIDYLKAQVSGSGEIGYKGEPKSKDIPKKKVHKL